MLLCPNTKENNGVFLSEKESQKIIQFLDGLGVQFDVLEHAPVFTSADAARVRNSKPEQGVKAIVLKASSKAFVLACVSGDKKVDLEKLAVFLNVGNVSLASPSEVLEKTGCEIGSVSPFGNLFGLKTFFDKRILETPVVEFNIGLHTKSIRMTSQSLASAVGAEIVDIAKI